ncbi:hypothetical protein [Metabacillus kandeliae]|nr:hypothetical protein [Metabacillus kandeliae]
MIPFLLKKKRFLIGFSFLFILFAMSRGFIKGFAHFSSHSL